VRGSARDALWVVFEQCFRSCPLYAIIAPKKGGDNGMPVLSDAELKMVAEIVTQMARSRGAGFDGAAKGVAFARAALIDPVFRARLSEVHRRLDVWRVTKEPRTILGPITALFRDLERDADVVLSAWKK
jgi:hypothetical protein